MIAADWVIIHLFINLIDVSIIVNSLISLIPSAIAIGTRIIAGLYVLGRINLPFTLIIAGVGLALYMSSRYFSRRYKHLHKEVQASDGATRSFLQECLENIVVIKSFAQEKLFQQKLGSLQLENFRIKVRRNAVSNVSNTSAYFLLTASYFATLGWGALQIAAGAMTFGNLTAFLQIIEQIKAPFCNLSGLNSQYYSMIASAERLLDIERLPDEVTQDMTQDVTQTRQDSGPTPGSVLHRSPAAPTRGLSIEKLILHDVSFSYDRTPILDHISMAIRGGESIALIGSSGVGKSTLLNLLLGLIAPDGGEIYLETTSGPIAVNAGTRNLFAYVPQTNLILSGTIRENVSFFDAAISDPAITRVLETACLWSFVNELPCGLYTVVGERGLGLSEGQAQRLAIARALLADAPILLLDESTSAL